MITHSSQPIDTSVKLAALWASLMSLYIYADYFEMKIPQDPTKGSDTPFGAISPELLVYFSMLMIVPALMIFQSFFLKPIISKWLNIFFGSFYTIISLLIIIISWNDEWRRFFVMYNFIELLPLSLIIFSAIKWPKQYL
ncbi:MAG: hypothetical protein JXQ90_23140 [Cyclobacteriaceae bacterium]